MEEKRDIDLIVMDIITHAGDARSSAIEAIRAARNGSFDEAAAKMKACEGKMVEAHHLQTDLLAAESNGTPVPVSLILVHAQDHIMNAMTVRELAVEMIGMMKENSERRTG